MGKIKERRHRNMKMNQLLHQIMPPCAKCPYKLGLVHAIVNPCPQCKENGYKMFTQFRNRMVGGETDKAQQ